MAALQLAALSLYVAAAATGHLVTVRDSHHRPVAWYLTGIVALDLLRLGRSALLPPANDPRVGWELVLRNLEAGAYLAVILALPALAVVLFLRRHPGPVLGAWALLWLFVVASYPDLRGESLLGLYGCIEAASFAVSAGCVLSWARSPRLLKDRLSSHIVSGLAIIAGSGAVLLLPQLRGLGLVTNWTAVVAVNAVMIACVLVAQLRQLTEAV